MIRILTLLFLLLFITSCDQETLLEISNSARQKLDEFRYHVVETKEHIAKAMQDIRIISEANFKSSETNEYIHDARKHLEKVKELKRNFEDLVKTTDFYFAYAYRKANETKDPSLKAEYISYINKKKREFVELYKQIYSSLLKLEEDSDKLNDILNGLEIAASMSIIEKKKEQMSILGERIQQEIEEIENKVDEGYKLLNVELSMERDQNEIFPNPTNNCVYVS